MLPAARVVDHRLAQNAGRPVEIEKIPGPGARSVFQNEVAVQQHSLDFGEEVVIAIEVAPARLHHTDLRIREVVDVVTGERYQTRGGDWVLATSQDVSDGAEKRELLAKYDADVVDMEGAAVAQVAKEHGLEFAAVKSISDEAGFMMPPLTRFINQNGKFVTGRFLLYVALRPKWWAVLGKIRTNTAFASASLCRAVEHLIEGNGSSQICWPDN